MGKKLGKCWRVPSYVLVLWKQLPWPVRNRLSAKCSCLDLWGTDSQCEDELPWPTGNRLMERGSLWMNFPDPQGTDSWSEGLYRWISLTHKAQTCGARDLDIPRLRIFLLTALTHKELPHGAKAGANELTDVCIGWKVYGLEWNSPPSFQSFIWSQ